MHTQPPHAKLPNRACTIIAGPCSVDADNIHEIMEMSRIHVTNTTGEKCRAVAGTRVVGLKSRTDYAPDGKGMGIDLEVYRANLSKLLSGKSASTFDLPPSAKYSIDIFEKTNFLIATEVCSPILQLVPLSGKIPQSKMMPWNSSVNQLGWPLKEIAVIAKQNDWFVGIKNGKLLGETIKIAESEAYTGKTSLEKAWRGLQGYTQMPKEKIIMIQRGVDTESKGDYRNYPIHITAKRLKQATGNTMFFDPSHSLGPKLRSQIVAATIEAMKIQLPDGRYLYDGVLIEVGTSQTDTEQHITVQELQDLCDALSKFRDLVSP